MEKHGWMTVTMVSLVLLFSMVMPAVADDEGRPTYIRIESPTSTGSEEGVYDIIKRNVTDLGVGEFFDRLPSPVKGLNNLRSSLNQFFLGGLDVVEKDMNEFSSDETDASGQFNQQYDTFWNDSSREAEDQLVDMTGLPFNPRTTVDDSNRLADIAGQKIDAAKRWADEKRSEIRQFIGLDRGPNSTSAADYDGLMAGATSTGGAAAGGYDASSPSSPRLGADYQSQDTGYSSQVLPPIHQALKDIGVEPPDEGEEPEASSGPGEDLTAKANEEDLESARICMNSRLKGIRDRVNQLVAQVQRLIPRIKSGGFDRLAAERLKNQGCWIVSTISDAYRWCGMPMERTSETAIMQEAARNICNVTFPTSDETKKDKNGSDGKSGFTCSGGPCYWLQCDGNGKCTRTYVPPNGGGNPSNSAPPSTKKDPQGVTPKPCIPDERNRPECACMPGARWWPECTHK